MAPNENQNKVIVGGNDSEAYAVDLSSEYLTEFSQVPTTLNTEVYTWILASVVLILFNITYFITVFSDKNGGPESLAFIVFLPVFEAIMAIVGAPIIIVSHLIARNLSKRALLIFYMIVALLVSLVPINAYFASERKLTRHNQLLTKSHQLALAENTCHNTSFYISDVLYITKIDDQGAQYGNPEYQEGSHEYYINGIRVGEYGQEPTFDKLCTEIIIQDRNGTLQNISYLKNLLNGPNPLSVEVYRSTLDHSRAHINKIIIL